MSITLRLALRDWDFITPILVGDVKSNLIELKIDRVNALPPDLANNDNYDGGEYSFSRYLRDVCEGAAGLVGVPHFIMRAFRHRCIITAAKSELVTIEQLAGKRIGLTGWPDSGNTWTRAILKHHGVSLDSVEWYVGRLTNSHPVTDRLQGFGQPGRVMNMPDNEPLVDALRAGRLDAVFTPFMPDGFYSHDSGLRQLLPNCREQEVNYFKSVGFVPGIHVIAIKEAVIQQHPWLGAEISRLLQESYHVWMGKRKKYADTTPWLLDELVKTDVQLPTNWNCTGLQSNVQMIKVFATEMYEQGLVDRYLKPEELFSYGV